MINAKISSAISAALQAYKQYGSFDAVKLVPAFEQVFNSDKAFMDKVDDLDAVFNDNPPIEELREVFFDLLMISAEGPAFESLSPAFSPWAEPGRDAILQPPKPQIRPSEQVLEHAAGHDLHPEAAD